MMQAFTEGMQHEVFATRSMAAKHASKKFRAFQTMPLPLDPTCWVYEERTYGDGAEIVHDWALDKPWVAWCEVTKIEQPVIIITCSKDEIESEVPDIFLIEPITPQAWERERLRQIRAETLKLEEDENEFVATVEPEQAQVSPTIAAPVATQSAAVSALLGMMENLFPKK